MGWTVAQEPGFPQPEIEMVLFARVLVAATEVPFTVA